ncbi:hypothetical protein [Aurantimonas sp. VKM B-3413]|uniref:hypothetical protein n=1 Tax=Aurantimonas sp. VKM B-3413 TaxID=2779401 RepID=UPI001E648340|nr:hypothetical protein [Aurantimonas sp. VKM B-3413]MCB8838599.1 hypothetical protein [Aurantimonas sp. VKM B-3413]
MIRKTLLALAAFAVAGIASISAASAGSYGNGYSDNSGYASCHWEKRKVVDYYDDYGHAHYKWVRVRICD